MSVPVSADPVRELKKIKRKTPIMITAIDDTHSKDNLNRRVGIDRRQFSYTHYLPERRAGKDRRRDDDNNKPSESQK